MEAIIFCGIQATGKSTFYRQRFFRTHVRINLDMLKTRWREDILLRACIEAEQPFVVDNTNTLASERAKYITLAKTASFRIIGYYFQSKIDEALQRNAGRAGAERIPDQGLYMMRRRLQIPAYAEGFDRLYYVKIAGGGEFIVQEWRS
ncbi:MAG: AAA family ATPase [Chloroflexi bacterium]|nr:AAA family ATPase [Chloroflexota bacterium]